MVKEVVKVGRQGVKLFTKVILRFEYHIHTSFGFSNEFYVRYYNLIGEIG